MKVWFSPHFSSKIKLRWIKEVKEQKNGQIKLFLSLFPSFDIFLSIVILILVMIFYDLYSRLFLPFVYYYLSKNFCWKCTKNKSLIFLMIRCFMNFATYDWTRTNFNVWSWECFTFNDDPKTHDQQWSSHWIKLVFKNINQKIFKIEDKKFSKI